MVKLKLCKRFSGNFFFKAGGFALMSAITLFSCNDESMIAENNETNDYLLDEYAFFDPSDTLNITACEAEDIATAFMDEIGGVDNTFKSKGMRFSCRKTTVIPDDNREPALYAINLDPDGFCIVAATKKTETILAYSDQGKFDLNNLPDGLAEWLVEKIEIIQETREEASISTIKPNIPPKDGGFLPVAGKEADDQYIIDTYGPLLKTEWGQEYPFNIMCPDKGCYIVDKCCKAGCVAIAAAQVIRYWEPSVSYNTHTYSWGKMPNTIYPTKSDNYIRHNIGYLSMANLIHDVGVAVGMDYDCEQSGAKSERIPDVLKQIFEFSDDCICEELTNSKAEPKLINNILRKQPVIMAGHRTKKLLGLVYQNGHAWVCDGYKKVTHKYKNEVVETNKYYHMNWGWGGTDNGWFTLDLKLYESDHKDKADKGYIYKRKYITNIHPKAN